MIEDIAVESIKRVTVADEKAVNGILKLAFSACPLLRWLYPEPERYLESIDGFIEYYCGEVYARGTGVYEAGLKGAMLWSTASVHRDEDELMSFLVRSVPRDRVDDVQKLFHEFDRYHPSGAFSYLGMLGIDPMQRRHGLGRLLYDEALQDAERIGLVSYGEATSEQAVRIYSSLGGEVLGKVQVGSSPVFYPILHKPR
ncbi:GNAT family N-acetyltransferase [Burkholderia latens]|uniref:GNAT family N-acetyltransferase n=1 Tax=Burkholderia latens TaxID=488446 RepID=A0A6H9TIA5_9BURK|nr:GNAT family N-acetyltransferase [Burkholderia latens]KAB0644784.1 GNAT family N-acetyltransferase [Burkholderia latens]VWB17596.1 hypothetical protein BLA24064_00656 [Burkholderia latens]